MKRLNKLIVFGLIFTAFWSCKKEEIITNINPNAALVATLSTPTLVLLKDNELKDALTVSWATPDYGFQAAPTYSVYVNKKGEDFAKKATQLGVGTDLKKIFNTAELNKLLIGKGFATGVAGDVEIQVESLLGVSTKLKSSILSLKATPYVDKLDLASPWGLVGDATANGWNGPDQPMYRTSTANELVCYVSVNDGAIKFRRYNDWLTNLGSSGTVAPDPAQTGGLVKDGKDIAVKKGMYKFSIDTIALKYKIEPLSWGLVGDATTGGWNGPDMPMRYDPTIDMWRAEVKLTAGAIKFRLNNDWNAANYGATGSVEPAPIGTGGDLAAGGKNFGVTAGTYLVTLDLKKLKYTFTPYKPWGLVGDATPTGWGGPDTKFTYDLSTKKWVLNNIVLTAAAIKFRENDDWNNNIGATGTVEPLPIVSGATTTGAPGGKNLGVTAGTWSFELDLADPANPKYKGTKK